MEFGFDYLRDNMAIYKNAIMVQRDRRSPSSMRLTHLIDEARTR